MKEQLPASFIELAMLVMYLGSVTFLIGSIIFFWLIRKGGLITTILLIVFQVIVAIAFSVLIWVLWPFKFDIMFGFVCLPALLSEIITIPISALSVNRIIKMHK